MTVPFSMAVVCEVASNYCIIDHLSYINNIYASCLHEDVTNNAETVQVKFRDVFFDIKCSYQLDTQAYKNSVQLHKNKDLTLAAVLGIEGQRKRKRKRIPLESSEGSSCSSEENKEIDHIMKLALDTILHSNHKANFDASPSSTDVHSNNAGARAASRLVDGDRLLVNVCTPTPTLEYQELILTTDMAPHIDSLSQIINCVVIYKGSKPAVVPIGSKKYLLPPRSTFLLSDVENLSLLARQKEHYDVILIDPPWNNKSVKRKKGYHVLLEDDLELLPIPTLAAEGCIVGVWVTNNARQKQVVKERFFKQWGVEYCAEWHWLKLTKSGQTVIDMDCTQKKPYEHLLLGRICEKADAQLIPEHLVFASIPSSIHSHKPPLIDLLTKYLTPQARCLELFARSLYPGWTSWGNEVLKLQLLDYYTIVSSIPEEK